MRIALLTPYSGANLGDGAIHDAIVANFKKYAGDIEFISLVANPRTVTELHGTPAATSSGRVGPFDVIRPGASAAVNIHPPDFVAESTRKNLSACRWFAGAWWSTKQVPIIGNALLKGSRPLKWLWSRRYEPAHLRKSFELARSIDLILVCGGGQLNDSWGGAWGHPYVLFRWAAIGKLTGTPFAIGSVGVGAFSSWLTRFFIRCAVSWSAFRSYRDPESKARLSAWPITHGDPIAADFAYTLPAKRSYSETQKAAYRIAISPIRFGAHRRGLPGQEETYQKYLRCLAMLALKIADSKHDIVFVTSSRDDAASLEGLFEIIHQIRPDMDTTALEKLPSHTCRELMDSLSTVDVVVASRLHSIILAQRCACLTMALSFEDKVDAHMRLFCMDRFLIDASDANVDDIFARFEELIEDFTSLRRSTHRRVAELSCRVDRQYHLLLELARHFDPR